MSGDATLRGVPPLSPVRNQSSNVWIFKRFVSNSNAIDSPQTQVKVAPAKGKVFRHLTALKTSISETYRRIK